MAVACCSQTRRLLSNTHALYQYCPIPRIMYPELEHELFCNIYYLRHLCDTAKFPDWPVQKPVRARPPNAGRASRAGRSRWGGGLGLRLRATQIELLKDILDEWKREVEKKAPPMSADDAYSVLGITRGRSARSVSLERYRRPRPLTDIPAKPLC